jgi:hypothetical protein
MRTSAHNAILVITSVVLGLDLYFFTGESSVKIIFAAQVWFEGQQRKKKTQ